MSSTNRTADLDFSGVARAARATLGYTIFVILFGAIVRITGSGAGCGQHWPTCNGEIAHLPRRLETVIELTHRVTSAGALVAVLAFTAVAVTGAPRGHRLRRAAYGAVVLMICEALIGAALVLYRLVAHDTSSARAFVMPAHLLSTYALVAVLTLATLWSRPDRTLASTPALGAGGRAWLVLGAVAILIVATTGAITALGDTLYPPTAGSLAGRVTEDQGSSAHFLQRLRVLHPVLAVFAAMFVATLAGSFAKSTHGRVRHTSFAVQFFAGAQVLAGVCNVLLSAPGWMQVVHLALALGLWIAFVSLAGTLVETDATGVRSAAVT